MKKIVAAALTLLTVLALAGTPAEAKGPAVTAAAIAVTCHLPAFPTPAGTTTCGTNSTDPTKLGVAAGVIAGVDNKNSPYVGVCATCAVDSKKITYNEACVAAEPPAVGFAQGSLNIHGQAVTKVTTGGGGLENFNAWVPFTWTRVGVIAVVLTGKLNATGANAVITFKTSGNTANDLVGDVAVGALIPLGVPGTCLTPAPLDILVPAIDVGA